MPAPVCNFGLFNAKVTCPEFGDLFTDLSEETEEEGDGEGGTSLDERKGKRFWRLWLLVGLDLWKGGEEM